MANFEAPILEFPYCPHARKVFSQPYPFSCTFTKTACNPNNESCQLQKIIRTLNDIITEFRQRSKERYDKYLKSDQWDARKKDALEFYGNHCMICNETKQLNVHHNNYDRLYEEQMSDLVVLCRNCHAKFHNKEA